MISSIRTNLKRAWCNDPFRTAFIFFIFAYSLLILFSYPAIFWGDTPSQIAQGFNAPEETSDYLRLLSPNRLLNNHHPVVHTILIHLFLLIGKSVFDSYNVGIFLFSLFQLMLILLLLSKTMAYLQYRQVPFRWLAILMLYYALSPRLQNHMMLVTKDIPYGAGMLLFLISIDDIINNGIVDSHSSLKSIFAASAFMIIFRNEGIYVVFISLSFIALRKKELRKSLLSIVLLLLLLWNIITGLIYPALLITPGSRREMLSIPFQQTARYVKTYPSEITEDEKQAINAVLDYDSLAELFVYNRSDSVKSTFNEDATTEELLTYFNAWFHMFLKHPLNYIATTMHHIEDLWNPFTERMYRVPYNDSSHLMSHTNQLCHGYVETDFHYPSVLQPFRSLYEKAGELLSRIPPISLLSHPWFYFYSTVFVLTLFIRKKEFDGCSLFLPIILQFLVCMAGPVVGVFRYMFPMALCIPVALLLGMQDMKEKIRHQ